MKTLIIFAALASLAFALPTNDDFAFESFKVQFNKAYESEEDEQYHKDVFLLAKAYIDRHNADPSNTYTLGINEFTDIEHELFIQRNGYLGSAALPSNSTVFKSSRRTDLPDEVDWRTKGVVTKVKNQGSCGSCWAFSTTGSLEGQHALKTDGNPLVSLSEQNLMDCSRKEGNKGCKGGLMIDAFKYIKENGGIDTEESYPYKAENGKCRFTQKNVGATCTGYVSIPKKDCDSLKKAIAEVGPISVAMDASEMSFQLYERGIYDPKKCSSTKLDHGVLAVGYGTKEGKDYWIIKNSWGRSWGMEGYFEIYAKDNLCGICTAASYPTV